MKWCSKCIVSKELTDFPTDSNREDGVANICKSCKRLSRIKKGKTVKGVLSDSYMHQLGTSKRRGHKPPTYNRAWLLKWATDQDIFHALYKAWVNSGYERGLKPSIDRKKDSIGYTKDNIQLMTVHQNTIKGTKDRWAEIANA